MAKANAESRPFASSSFGTEQSAARAFKIFDALLNIPGRYFKVRGQAMDAIEGRRAAVDQFFGHGDFVPGQGLAAGDAALGGHARTSLASSTRQE